MEPNLNQINIEQKEKDKDKAFNRLKGLQALLKKEASLRELFTKTSEKTKDDIETECRNIYEKKLDVFFTLKRFKKSEASVSREWSLYINTFQNY